MRFIVNANDFGISQKVNNAIYNSAKDGYISSATMMAVAPYIEEAAEMTKDLPNTSFGAHLVYDGDFDSLSGIPGNFNDIDAISPKSIDPRKLDSIVDEFSKQIERLYSIGVEISHMDTHHHLHLYPLILIAISKVSKKYNIPKVRSQRMLEKKSLANRSYREIHSYISKALGLVQPYCYTDFFNLESTGVGSLKENDICEIMCHPDSSYNDERYFNDTFYTIFDGRIINYNDL